jgi:Nucleotide-diphospho-sugar transferase
MKKWYYIFLACFLSVYAQEKIKMYALCTPSHEILKDQFFLPSLQDDFELIIEYADQTCSSAKFMEEGWTQTTVQKVDLIIRAIQENWNSVFIFSDVDIQFFAPIQKKILKLIKDKDIVMQKNSPSGVLCTGFFACRGNSKTLQLWQDVKKMMEADSLSSDQISFNRCIRRFSKKNPYDVVWAYLPHSFYGGGTLTGREWLPGRLLPIPHNIVMHHANWTKGVKNKIEQLTYVRNEVLRRCKRFKYNFPIKLVV